MDDSGRRKALHWPYRRHIEYEKVLRESNARWFRMHGYKVNSQMPYLLDNWENWPKNIILPEVAEYIQIEQERRIDTREGFPLHKYIHHGLSSQAMLFNFVGPMIVSGDLNPLKQAFIEAGIVWPKGEVRATFELEDRNVFHEDTGQPTSIDLVIQGNDNAHSLFIEAKLVEREFGGCSVFQNGDCTGRNPSTDFNSCYLHFIGRRYWILLEKYDFLKGSVGTSPICPLALYYQFFRELLFAIESNGDFVLLFDERNPSFCSENMMRKRDLLSFLLLFVPKEIENRIYSISIQKVVRELSKIKEYDWLSEFKNKYDLI
jgi:POLQ-like helicase